MALAVEQVLVDEQPLHAHRAPRVDAVGRDAHLVRARARARVRARIRVRVRVS
jgi:hypothetical protein